MRRALLLACPLLLAACGDSGKTVEAGSLESQVQSAMDTAGRKLSAAQEEYRKLVDGRLDGFDADIAKLREQAKTMSGEARARLDEALAGLAERRRALGEQMRQWTAAREGDLARIEQDIDRKLDELERTLDSVLSSQD